ncbi:hypothetical protein AB0O01_34555 [Streptomyces sp. NPDC093252]|uniref:hypothetical protein n=1 Tax=Streptomyces sp. NPDC093252 TaxID=3154980 RepID=UPI00342692FC
MTTLSHLRKAALALPEAEEGARSRTVVAAFSVRGKEFVSVSEGGEVRLRLPQDEVRRASAAHPSGAPLLRGGTPTGFRVPSPTSTARTSTPWSAPPGPTAPPSASRRR